MSECAKCGVSVSVLGGMEFDDTDLCSSCLYSRVLELEQALRDLGKIPAVDFYNGNALITASEIIAKVLAREEKEESHGKA